MGGHHYENVSFRYTNFRPAQQPVKKIKFPEIYWKGN